MQYSKYYQSIFIYIAHLYITYSTKLFTSTNAEFETSYEVITKGEVQGEGRRAEWGRPKKGYLLLWPLDPLG